METLEFYHDPVLLTECLEYLNISSEGTYADCTLGGGGHSFAIAQKLSNEGTLHCFDRDPEAISFASKRLADVSPKLVFHPVAFGNLGSEIEPALLDGVLYDLGISSRQVDSSKRGFTFAGNFPLDLRMDTRAPKSAQEWLRETPVEEMARAFYTNSDLDRSNKLAGRLKTFVEESDSLILPEDIKHIASVVYPDHRRDMPSLLARIFQAIRMEVNGELKEIELSLTACADCLKPGGRLVIISYHSVEDRCVKNSMALMERDCICPERLPICACGGNHRKFKKVLRKPLVPSKQEISKNPRSRSAKLRVYERV